MRVEVEPKKIKELIQDWDKIDPKPQYQRTPVWKIDRKRLLIDSIIKGYDLPKFYMSKLENNLLYNYEVCDGQQRLRTIYEFTQDGYALGQESSFNGVSLAGKKFSELDGVLKQGLLEYDLTFTVIVQADQREIRDLFARLQRGMGLNQAELRRALSTHIGIFVESIVDNHKFFRASGILDIRNKCQDYIDHVIAYLVNHFNKDFKGNFLKDVYEQISADRATEYVKEISQVLDEMEKINLISAGIFRNKWGFVDTFILIHHFLKEGKTVMVNELASRLIEFERLRKQHNKNPAALIDKINPTEDDKRLYTYITSFQKDGSLKNNMRRRNEVFIAEFGNLFV